MRQRRSASVTSPVVSRRAFSLSSALACRHPLQDGHSLRFEVFEIGSVLDGSNQRSGLVCQRITDASSEFRDDCVPISQGAEEPIDIAMRRVPGIVANPHLHAGGLYLVEQFDQCEMGLQKVCLAAQFGIARILSFAERMPGVVTASSCREFDGIALAKLSSTFGTIRIALDEILMVEH